MKSEDFITIAFDTASNYCAVALSRNDQILDCSVLDKSHQKAEDLAKITKNILNKNGFSEKNISLIGVGTGPGNFTGIRMSISFAKGLGLALNIPVIGVNYFEACCYGNFENTTVIIPAKGNKVYFQDMSIEDSIPKLGTIEEAYFMSKQITKMPPAAQTIKNISRITAKKSCSKTTSPCPFYIQPVNAVPFSQPPPVILQ